MVTIQRLIEGSQIGTGIATYYAVPDNTRTKITILTVTNTTGTARTVTIHLVPSGATASAANMVVSARNVAAGQSLVLPEAAHVLESGGSIQALASNASALTLMASGAEVT
jgi:hypothetical protein